MMNDTDPKALERSGCVMKPNPVFNMGTAVIERVACMVQWSPDAIPTLHKDGIGQVSSVVWVGSVSFPPMWLVTSSTPIPMGISDTLTEVGCKINE